MCCWWWTTTNSPANVRIKQEQMRSAEAKLLDMAPRFQRHNNNNNNHKNDFHIEVFDTSIPKSSITACLRTSKPQQPQCNNVVDDANQDEMLIMHAIKVTSNKNNKDLSSSSSLPLVLLHGYGGAAAYYYRNLVGLLSYFPVIYAVDMLGWGLSSRPPLTRWVDTSVAATESFFVDSFEAWRSQNNIEQMILAGHSMGGYMSVAYCERYPHRVHRLILISPAGTPEESDDAMTPLRDMIDSSSWTRKLAVSIYRYLYQQGRSIGEILRALPQRIGIQRVVKFVDAFPAVANSEDADEPMVLAKYLYYNMVLPGSGEYGLHRLLNPFAFAKHSTMYRIPKLYRIGHVAFLYGDRDFMDIHTGGLAVQQLCDEQNKKKQTNTATKTKQEEEEESDDNNNNTSSSPTAPMVSVYRVRDAGHMLMWDNWEEFNSGIILAAGGGQQVPDKNNSLVVGNGAAESSPPPPPMPVEEFYHTTNRSSRSLNTPRLLQSLSSSSTSKRIPSKNTSSIIKSE